MVASIFYFFYIIINQIKYQLTENEENLFFGEKIAHVSVVLSYTTLLCFYFSI